MVLSTYAAVRTLHVLAVSLLVGGSAVLWLGLRVGTARLPVRLLSWFEAVFWGGLGIVVFTGLGNLVAFGIPPVDSHRGIVLTAKFVAVLGLAVFALVRAAAVIELQRAGNGAVGGRRLRLLYAATAWLSTAAVLLAGVLARG
ncbi:CopD domain protein [Natronomonas pharaonis DSM 2160]|uniref:CopD domain protein n=1 Tax=Natronomonas pharaonis (strain ATCC 35678 / DSM 2160 / CIP 103997 / JCM 8858 / NBRC 14720 / NCIMB 2260 / Gabara) TaxID=348780 RepID=A0A1U7EYI8_NATPD|nr:CopD family protein [Natronomonas pharaonis]CAI50289.1 CopD domain protein [Natronomonas pharaonis DSM 2160]